MQPGPPGAQQVSREHAAYLALHGACRKGRPVWARRRRETLLTPSGAHGRQHFAGYRTVMQRESDFVLKWLEWGMATSYR